MDWENPKHQLAAREPRKGRRLSLAATVVTPQGPLVCYSCHLEVHLTSAGRQQLRVLRTQDNNSGVILFYLQVANALATY